VGYPVTKRGAGSSLKFLGLPGVAGQALFFDFGLQLLTSLENQTSKIKQIIYHTSVQGGCMMYQIYDLSK
jgi:lipid-A-disaccharide synthase-like uncharacterized protein